ncbi:MAG TPA: 2OG-Fe(II) oxygenase, partial [Chitinophagales bacterium]|nr:2OG-Fe(II) oxygenase [Chitinophagales bacterium]
GSYSTQFIGIKNLVPDPVFEGGGLHQIKPGGYLKVHADFNKHRGTGLDRRLNVLIYLNENWDESYGGHFELWDKEMKNCEVKILPLFNRMAMFNTTDFSYHGHPNPLTCPPDRSRRSIALYYYSNGRPASEVTAGQEHRITTAFVARPEDSGEMKRYNNAVYWAQQLTPPILVKIAKKVLNRN